MLSSCDPSLVTHIICIGTIYIHRCPGQNKIPIWLIVFGVFSLLQTIINCMRRCIDTCRRANTPEDEDNTKSSIANRSGGFCEGLVSLFLFAWLIVGSVWVFGYWNTYAYSGTCKPHPELHCCHPVPYLFSFITLIAIYAGAVLSLVICCCCCCCMWSLLF